MPSINNEIEKKLWNAADQLRANSKLKASEPELRYIMIALYKTLTRRSQRAYLTWRRFRMLLEKHPIAEPRIYVNIWQAA
ncbi:MAG: hypothetical protein QHH10_09460 [Peptococcaceae bacterium]|jgi:hypothetical protein|nr:hypothetical protein [Peptococcaceae bacterium]MDH7525525.1 hypothetical protein [Peptococcaceae bacterium]